MRTCRSNHGASIARAKASSAAPHAPQTVVAIQRTSRRAYPVLPFMRMDELVRPSTLDRALRPLHRWVWRDPHRRARKLLRFAETEADGARDLSRAAELTTDALLRRLYLRHALDEQRHAELFRRRGRSILATRGNKSD